MEIYGAKINGLNDPIGFGYEPLLCSWKVRKSKGTKQANAKIQVATDADLAAIVYEKEGDLNCTGEVLDFALQPHTRYFYQITVESDVGEVARSEIHYFETAKLNDPWQAKWIGVAGDDTTRSSKRPLRSRVKSTTPVCTSAVLASLKPISTAEKQEMTAVLKEKTLADGTAALKLLKAEFDKRTKALKKQAEEGEEKLHLIMVDNHIPAGAKLY